MDNIFLLNQKQTSFDFYNHLLPLIGKKYGEKNRNSSLVKPVISMEKLEYLDASSMVNLLGLGYSLSKYHKEPIELILVYNERLLYFLYHSRFFQISDKLKIFEYDSRLVGGFSNFSSSNSYREKHKIHFYPYINGYYTLNNENEREKVRAKLYENMRDYKIPSDFSDVLNDIPNMDEFTYNEIINVFTEICCNAILYSQFGCFCYLQTNKFGTKIVVSDVGIGFRESLNKKNIKIVENDSFLALRKELNLNLSKSSIDLFTIFEVLEYSKNKQRKNLWELKEIVKKLGGDLKIHYNSTQVVFSGNRCGNCKRENSSVEECFRCLLKDVSRTKKISPIRRFSTGLSGVHIEIDIPYKKGDKI